MVRASATSAILTVLAIGTLAYTYFVDVHTVSDADRADRVSDVFPSFRVDEVREIEIEHGSESIHLERGAKDRSSWLLTSPVREPANPGTVSALLRDLELANRLREVPIAETVGLNAPRARGRITLGPLSFAFALGGDAPRPEGSAYMEIGAETPFVVDRALKVALLQGADAYRSRELVPFGQSAIARLQVHGAAGDYELERSGESFRVGSTTGPRASRSMVDRILEDLVNLRFDAFLDEEFARGAISVPTHTIRIVPSDGPASRLEIQVGTRCPGQSGNIAVVLAPGTSRAGCVPSGALTGLDRTGDALIDLSVFDARSDEIEELRLDSGQPGSRVEVVRKGTGWHERAPQDRDLGVDETDSVEVLARALADSRAVSVNPATPGDRLAVTARATVTRTTSHSEESIELSGPSRDGSVTARRLDDGFLLHLTHDVALRLESGPVALRPRKLWNAPFDPGSIVALSSSCGPTLESLAWEHGRWVLKAPAGLPVDAFAASDLASRLAHAYVDAWIAERDDGTFGLTAGCSVSITLDPSGEVRRKKTVGIVFGNPSDGGRYARTTDSPDVFIAPPALVAAVQHPAIDGSALRIQPSSTSRVTVTGNARVVTLLGAGDTLVRQTETPALDAGSSDALARAVAGFHATGAIHAGGPEPGEGFRSPTLRLEAVGTTESGASVSRIVVGASGKDADQDVYYARAQGVDATFAVPRDVVDAILDSL